MATSIDLKDRFRGSLLGLAVGDAVGTTVDNMPRGSFPPVTDMVGGGRFSLMAGQVSLSVTIGTYYTPHSVPESVPVRETLTMLSSQYVNSDLPSLFSTPPSLPPSPRSRPSLPLLCLSSPQWTDDTSMALLLAESLVEKGAFDPMDQGSRYWKWYQVCTVYIVHMYTQ